MAGLEMPLDVGRRVFLRGAGLVAASVLSFPPAGAESGEAANPPSVGAKFARDGRVLTFPGNTIICHLDQHGSNAACFHALLDVYRDAPAHGFMRKVTLLPPSSYHMTVFDCIAGFDRNPETWPKTLPPDAPMPVYHDILAERLKGFDLAVGLPLRMTVNLDEPSADARPLRLRLKPVDAAETAKLRGLRDRLSAVLGLRGSEHGSYEFHITLGYLIQWLSPEERTTFRATLARWREMVAMRCPVIELGAPEYCTFDDMFAFHRRFYLA